LSWLAAGGPAVASDSPSAVDSTVHFKGTSVFTFGDGCSFVHQTFDSPFTDSQGHTGSFSLEGCVDFAAEGYDFVGTYVLTPPDGGVLNGAASGTLGATDPPRPCTSGATVSMDLTMAGAPLRIDRIVGTWCSPATPDTPGPIRGVLR